MKLETIKKLVAISSLVTMMPLTAFAGDISQDITPTAGALSVTSPAEVPFTAVAVTTADQAISLPGVGLSNINPIDTRGTLVGFTVTATLKNIIKQLADLDVSGDAVAVDGANFSGTYNCVNTHATNGASRYRVQVTGAGAVGVATFKWLSPADVETAGVVTSGAGNLLDSGITVNWNGVAPTVGDVFAKRVGCVKYTSITHTPATLEANSGSLSGLSIAGAVAFSGAGATSAADTIFTAEGGSGGGDFQFDMDLDGTFRKNGLTGLHSGTMTFTAA